MHNRNPRPATLDHLGDLTGWTASLLFWVGLLSAAGLYAIAALAPKLQTHLNLKQRYRRNQTQLVAMEQQTQSLRSVVEALKTDPEFVEELARVDLRAASPDEERIPVSSRLSFNGLSPTVAAPHSSGKNVWYKSIVESVGRLRKVRLALLVSSGLLVLLTFTFLHEPQVASDGSADRSQGTLFKRLMRRYCRSVDGH